MHSSYTHTRVHTRTRAVKRCTSTRSVAHSSRPHQARHSSRAATHLGVHPAPEGCLKSYHWVSSHQLWLAEQVQPQPLSCRAVPAQQAQQHASRQWQRQLQTLPMAAASPQALQRMPHSKELERWSLAWGRRRAPRHSSRPPIPCNCTRARGSLAAHQHPGSMQYTPVCKHHPQSPNIPRPPPAPPLHHHPPVLHTQAGLGEAAHIWLPRSGSGPRPW